MEIDLSGVTIKRTWLYGAIVAAIAILLLLGRTFTPENGQILSWQEWQVRKLRQAYRSERQTLLADIQSLANLLDSQHPDPARVQVQANLIRSHLARQKVESLAEARKAVERAAQATLDWASGVGEYNAAIRAVQDAMALIQNE
jgi:hypothetical protein